MIHYAMTLSYPGTKGCISELFWWKYCSLESLPNPSDHLPCGVCTPRKNHKFGDATSSSPPFFPHGKCIQQIHPEGSCARHRSWGTRNEHGHTDLNSCSHWESNPTREEKPHTKKSNICRIWAPANAERENRVREGGKGLGHCAEGQQSTQEAETWELQVQGQLRLQSLKQTLLAGLGWRWGWNCR